MKEKRILEALSEVRDEFVEEVDFVNVDSKIGDRKNAEVSTKRHRKIRWVKWLGVVAALVVIVSVGSAYFVPKNSSKNYFSASVTNGMVSLEKEELFAMAKDVAVVFRLFAMVMCVWQLNIWETMKLYPKKKQDSVWKREII